MIAVKPLYLQVFSLDLIEIFRPQLIVDVPGEQVGLRAQALHVPGRHRRIIAAAHGRSETAAAVLIFDGVNDQQPALACVAEKGVRVFLLPIIIIQHRVESRRCDARQMLIGRHVGVNAQREKPLTVAQGKAFAVDRHFNRRLPDAKRQLAVRCRPGLLPGDLLTQAVFALGQAGRRLVVDTALPFNLITVAATVNNLPSALSNSLSTCKRCGCEVTTSVSTFPCADAPS